MSSGVEVALPSGEIGVGPECAAANEAIMNMAKQLSAPTPLLIETVNRKRKSARTKIMAAMRLSFGTSSKKTIPNNKEWPKEEAKDEGASQENSISSVFAEEIHDTILPVSTLGIFVLNGIESRIHEARSVYETEILDPLLVDLVGDGVAAEVNAAEKKVRFSFFSTSSSRRKETSTKKNTTAASRIFATVDDENASCLDIDSNGHVIATGHLETLAEHLCTEKLHEAAERRLSESVPLVLVESIQERQKRAKTKLSAVFQFTKNAVKARSVLHNNNDSSTLAAHPDELLKDHVKHEPNSRQEKSTLEFDTSTEKNTSPEIPGVQQQELEKAQKSETHPAEDVKMPSLPLDTREEEKKKIIIAENNAAAAVIVRESIAKNTTQQFQSNNHGKMKQWSTESSLLDPVAGTLLAEMEYKLTQVINVDEDDEILIVRPTTTLWQIGLAGTDSPEWECPVAPAEEIDSKLHCDIRGHGKEILRHYLSDCRPKKTAPPHLLIVVDAIDLMLLQNTAENKARREVLDTLEKRCDEIRDFALRDIGFRSAVILDAKHATLYEHAARTSLVVDVTSHGIGSLGIWCGHVLPQTHLAQEWGDNSADKCAAVGDLVKRALEAAPLDTRGDLASAVYLSGVEVPSLGEDRKAVGTAVLAGFSPSLIPNERAKVVIPKLYASSAWIGASLVAALDEASYAFDPNHRKQPDKFERGCFDASMQYPNTRDTYWAALLAGAKTLAVEAADNIFNVAPPKKRSLDTAAAQAELKLHLSDRDNGSEAKPFRPFIKRPIKTGPWWLAKSWGSKPQLAPLPDGYDPTTQDDDSIQHIRERKKKAETSLKTPSTDTTIKHHTSAEANAVAASSSEFTVFREDIKKQSIKAAEASDLEAFEQELENRAAKHLFSCTQMAELVNDAPTVRLKLCIVESLSGRCHDPNKGSCVVDLFTMADIKQKVAASLAARDKILKRANSASANRSSLLASGRGRGRNRSMSVRSASMRGRGAAPGSPVATRRKTMSTANSSTVLPSPSSRHSNSPTNPLHTLKNSSTTSSPSPPSSVYEVSETNKEKEETLSVPIAAGSTPTSPLSAATNEAATPPPPAAVSVPLKNTPPADSTAAEQEASILTSPKQEEAKKAPQQRRHSEQINALLHQRPKHHTPSRRMTTTAALVNQTHPIQEDEREEDEAEETSSAAEKNKKGRAELSSSPPQHHSKQISNFLHQRPTKHVHQAVNHHKAAAASHHNSKSDEATPVKNRAELTEGPRPSTTAEDLARPESMRRFKLASTSEGTEFLAACDQRDKRQLSSEKRRKDDAERRAKLHDRQEAAISVGRNSISPNRVQVPKASHLEWTPHDATALLAEAATVQRLLLDDNAIRSATLEGEFDIYTFYEQQKDSLPSHFKMYKSFLTTTPP